MYDYSTWKSMIRFIDPNILDNHTFDYDKDSFYSDGRLKKNSDGYYVGPNGYYDKAVSEEEKVTYRFNNLFFRSDHFKKVEKDKVNILYSGCSWTYGSGMYEELTWPMLLSNKVKNYYSKDVNHFNVALPGASVFLSIKNIMAFIRNYGKPDYIFVNMPPIARDMKYDKKNNFFYSVVMGSGYFEGNYPKIYLEYIKNHSHEDSILKAVEQIKMLEDYCNESKIKLMWTYWHEADGMVYRDIKFDNIFFPISNFRNYVLPEDLNKSYYNNENNLPLWELAQDRHHPGSCWNIHCSEMFFDQFLRSTHENNN
jgi:hypothetical protein